jgi:hypothetical protein
MKCTSAGVNQLIGQGLLTGLIRKWAFVNVRLDLRPLAELKNKEANAGRNPPPRTPSVKTAEESRQSDGVAAQDRGFPMPVFDVG